MEKSGKIIRLKKDLYVNNNVAISKELIANHLYGVSYISLETALSYYGIIPKRVYAVRSMTTKRAKSFTTPLGNFEYTTVSVDYFCIGLRQEIIENADSARAKPLASFAEQEAFMQNQYAFLIATPNLRLQSVKAMQSYLTEDLRIDFEVLKTLDKDIVRQCIEAGKKKGELKLLEIFLSV